tara:strand:+ start:31533 stop:32339 length:807 start_codon:yes stop_codon:yes gene_type:complete
LKSDFPIGIFDSGIGGLTVAREITELMPHEKIVYYGDTLHLPYGQKSKQNIINYCSKICDFLIEQNCKAIIIACNTASCIALNNIKKKLGDDYLIFNVIDPVIKKIEELKSNNIGIIGTNTTIESGVYEKKIKEIEKNCIISSLATPLLAPMIETGFHDATIKRKIIATYLNHKKLKSIDTLILGCTHYPLIKKEINEIYNNKIEIISSLESIGRYIKNELKIKKLMTATKYEKKHEFYISDLTTSFQENAKSFFNKEIHLKEKNIFI